MVIILFAQVAETPEGKLNAVPIPVAPVVLCVMLVIGELTHNVGELDAGPTVLAGVTTIVPVAFKLAQPPVKGML